MVRRGVSRARASTPPPRFKLATHRGGARGELGHVHLRGGVRRVRALEAHACLWTPELSVAVPAIDLRLCVDPAGRRVATLATLPPHASLRAHSPHKEGINPSYTAVAACEDVHARCRSQRREQVRRRR